jgi:hypothetical protein
MTDALLIGCVSAKATTLLGARKPYRSELGRHRRAYAEQSGRPWFAVSARPDAASGGVHAYLGFGLGDRCAP